MMKILMVCLGNICRSPMAEGIMRKLGGKKVEVDSAGTADYHIGFQPDKRMIATAIEHGVDISNLRARQFQSDDFDSFDLIFAMDSSNYQNIISLAKDDNDKQKVKMILDNSNVPDPYYGGDEGFEHVYQLLHEACQKFLEDIE
ncbi:MAG: protein-tyrosine-phosphatase [Flavobacteriales bacterium]|nr:protein-tyrosine-phosphatase [Flavobacteriales bacterium]